ncbi:MAG: 50S ribosomal protein L35 [Proteobacteria bacterium CG1_02_64_396]|nr:MAG: 50S ribosomal protein L35 [Proteobacteria bacterium CG1_02_64_396]
MPKMKTNRGAAKRFKKTANGHYKYSSAFHNHILTKKSRKTKRNSRGTEVASANDEKSLKRLLPFV